MYFFAGSLRRFVNIGHFMESICLQNQGYCWAEVIFYNRTHRLSQHHYLLYKTRTLQNKSPSYISELHSTITLNSSNRPTR